MKPRRPRALQRVQRVRRLGRRAVARGLMLIDVLIAVLVFSVGVLAIVGLQSVAVQQSSQAQYRADATMLVSSLIGRMWLTDRQVTTLSTRFATGGPDYETWLATVSDQLPGAADFPPTVEVDSVASGPGSQPTARVTVTLRWKPPSAAATDPANSLVMVTQIR
jgi:type IV pilus assembly protein PilV